MNGFAIDKHHFPRRRKGRSSLPGGALVVLALSLPALPQAACLHRPQPLQALESAYEELRYHKDQWDVTRFRGAQQNMDGLSLDTLKDPIQKHLGNVRRQLSEIDRVSLNEEDRRALDIIEETVRRTTDDLVASMPQADATAACSYDPLELAGLSNPIDQLTERIYTCFGGAAERILVDGRILDRLSILGSLSHTEDAASRKRLFLALEPVWQAVNGRNDVASPYRALVRIRRQSWQSGQWPWEIKAREFGLNSETIEQWLVTVLGRWRDVAVENPVEPWDYYYQAGKANRVLDPHITRERLRPINDAFFTRIGAPPEALNIRYDIEPRAGKDPVAFTTFGARNRMRGNIAMPGEFWVFASYRVGGLGNLYELFHETAHGVHLAGIRTRPAFQDWPDSDTFTEALADMLGLEVFDSAWQQTTLGAAAAAADNLRAKYAGVVLDIAWALFELRVHRTPDADPNQIWTQLTQDYLGIRPYPYLSWWAMRGQLINAPGYMLNYAVGALIAAELRLKVREYREGKSFSDSDTSWYPWLVDTLYRFGLERSSQSVLEDFLGHTLTPDPLLNDISAMTNPRR